MAPTPVDIGQRQVIEELSTPAGTTGLRGSRCPGNCCLCSGAADWPAAFMGSEDPRLLQLPGRSNHRSAQPRWGRAATQNPHSSPGALIIPKKKVLFLIMGPPNEPPNWLQRLSGKRAYHWHLLEQTKKGCNRRCETTPRAGCRDWSPCTSRIWRQPAFADLGGQERIGDRRAGSADEIEGAASMTDAITSGLVNRPTPTISLDVASRTRDVHGCRLVALAEVARRARSLPASHRR